MPRYYNKTRGPVPLELPSGSTVVSAKTYIDISREDEGCGSVARAVRKGFLVAPTQRTEEVVVEPVTQAAPLATAEVELPEAPKAEENEIKADPEPEVSESGEESSSLSGKSSKRTRR